LPEGVPLELFSAEIDYEGRTVRFGDGQQIKYTKKFSEYILCYCPDHPAEKWLEHPDEICPRSLIFRALLGTKGHPWAIRRGLLGDVKGWLTPQPPHVVRGQWVENPQDITPNNPPEDRRIINKEYSLDIMRSYEGTTVQTDGVCPRCGGSHFVVGKDSGCMMVNFNTRDSDEYSDDFRPGYDVEEISRCLHCGLEGNVEFTFLYNHRQERRDGWLDWEMEVSVHSSPSRKDQIVFIRNVRIVGGEIESADWRVLGLNSKVAIITPTPIPLEVRSILLGLGD